MGALQRLVGLHAPAHSCRLHALPHLHACEPRCAVQPVRTGAVAVVSSNPPKPTWQQEKNKQPTKTAKSGKTISQKEMGEEDAASRMGAQVARLFTALRDALHAPATPMARDEMYVVLLDNEKSWEKYFFKPDTLSAKDNLSLITVKTPMHVRTELQRLRNVQAVATAVRVGDAPDSALDNANVALRLCVLLGEDHVLQAFRNGKRVLVLNTTHA